MSPPPGSTPLLSQVELVVPPGCSPERVFSLSGSYKVWLIPVFTATLRALPGQGLCDSQVHSSGGTDLGRVEMNPKPSPASLPPSLHPLPSVSPCSTVVADGQALS